MGDVDSLFFQRWYCSREENTAGAIVYRPSSFPFPPTRFREAVEFSPEGSVTYFGLGADDRRVPISGHWERIDRTVVRTEFEAARAPSAEWRLTEAAGSYPRLDVVL
jgi:hypothetical protein